MNLLADVPVGVSTYLDHIQFLNSETSPEMLAAMLYLFFGGVMFAFLFGAWSMTIRATKGAASEIEL